jgi:hypothetical protein
VLFLALLVLISGCQSLRTVRLSPGRADGSPYTAAHGGFTVRLPVGWTFVENPLDQVVALSPARGSFQNIYVKYTDLNDALPWTRRVLTPDLSPLGLADALIDDLSRDRNLADLRVLQRETAIIDGTEACKTTVRYRNLALGGVGLTKTCYASIHNSRLYILYYNAKTGQHYEEGLPSFEETVRSFQFGTASSKRGNKDKDFLPLSEKASLYIYRDEPLRRVEKILVLAVPMKVSVNGKALGYTMSKTYFRLDLLPGTYTIESFAENTSTLTLTLQAGKNYFVWQEKKWGWNNPRSFLHQVDETTGRKAIMECELIVPPVPDDELNTSTNCPSTY